MADYSKSWEQPEPTPYELAFADDPAALQAEIEADRSAPEWDSADSANYQARVEAGLESEAEVEAEVQPWPELQGRTEPELEFDYTDTGHPVITADVASDQPYIGMSRAELEPEAEL
jgi:hypothetical protein